MLRGCINPCFAAAAVIVVVFVGVEVTEYMKVDHLQLWGCLAVSLKCLGPHFLDNI
jgi:hypothetical protein